VAGVILAGGRGRRVGGRDKGLIRYRGRPLAFCAAERLAASCDVVVVSANRNLHRYAGWADVVTSDADAAYLGPLAGIRAALSAVRARWLLTCPCDAPDVGTDVPERLLRALRQSGGADVAVLRDAERLQPLLLALRGNLGVSIDAYLTRGGRSVRGWLDTRRVVEVRGCGHIANYNVEGSTRAGVPWTFAARRSGPHRWHAE
jgi:molybdopterin-guanine dinucleotide biosynthesis protein A